MFLSIAGRSQDGEPFHTASCVQSRAFVQRETCCHPTPAKHGEFPGAPFPAAFLVVMLSNFLAPTLSRFGAPTRVPLPRQRFRRWRQKWLAARSGFLAHVHFQANSWKQAD